jgi:addiction module RelE/StbE family toxin
MIYQVITTKRAFNDMDEISGYIANVLNAPQAADRLISDIEQQITKLNQMPYKFALVTNERLAQQGVRKIPINNYLVFYRVNERLHKVIVMRVLYSARNWVNLL